MFRDTLPMLAGPATPSGRFFWTSSCTQSRGKTQHFDSLATEGPHLDSVAPARDVDVVRVGRPLPALEQRLHAHEERRPFGAAVVHELERLLPALVPDADDGVVLIFAELEVDARADPLGGPSDHFPEHALRGLALQHLHVDPAAAAEGAP